MKNYHLALIGLSLTSTSTIFILSGQNNLFKFLSVVSGGLSLTASVSTVISDRKLQELKQDSNKFKSLHQSKKQELDKVTSKLSNFSGELKLSKDTIKQLQETNEQISSQLNKLQNVTKDDKQVIKKLVAKVEQLGQQCIDQEEELNQHVADFDDRLQAEVNQIVPIKVDQACKTIIKKELEVEYRLNHQASEIMEAQQKLMEDIFHRHQAQRHQLLTTNDTYKQHFEKTVEAHNRAYNELLIEKAQLEAQLNAARQINVGELLAPELIRDKQGKQYNVANYIADELWESYQIPLKVHGVTETENGYKAGYGYSVTADREHIADCIKQNREQWRDYKGIHQINEPHLPKHFPVIEVGFIIDRPPVLKDDEIYRFLERSSAFGQIIRDAQNHRKGGKPTLRVMSGTGGGKSLVGKLIIQEYCNHESDYEIRLSDPLHGSDQDYWNCPKVATDKLSAHKAFLNFANEHKVRSNKKSLNPNQKILGLFDEFDKQHSQDDKKLAAEIWTAIRHNQMRLILLGQSSEVGGTGWTWDEMNNCSMLFLGDGVATAIKHYKDIGFSIKYKNQLQRQYEQVKEWLHSKNEGLDAAKQYRVALLIIGQDAKFLELPPAQIEPVNNGKSWVVSKPFESNNSDIMSINTQNIPSTNINSSPTIEKETDKPPCKYCGSPNVKRNGKHPKTRKQQYTCNDCKQTPIKWTL